MEIVLGVLMLLVAIMGYRISILQKKLNEQQVNYDAFDRNYRIYKKIKSFMNKIIAGQISLNELPEFNNTMEEVKYLYDDMFIKFTEKIYSIGAELAMLNDKIKLLTGQDMSQEEFSERKEYMQNKSSLIKKAFINLPPELDSLFEPFLNVNKNRI